MKEKRDLTRLEIVAGDEYHTPVDAPRYLADRLLFNSRIVMMTKYIGIVLTTRQAAVKGLYDTRYWVESSHWIFTLIERCGGRFHITGLNHIKNTSGPVVFLSNHMSTLETMIFPGILQPLKNVTFVVKDELVRHRAFGAVMRSREPIVLSRTNPRDDFRIVMESGTELLSKGRSIIIFPQSTRRIEFRPGEFHSLGTKLAARAGVPIIPVAIKTDFWGHGRFSKYLGPIDRQKPIYMTFGEPVPVTGNGRAEHQQVIDFIMQNLKEWNKTNNPHTDDNLEKESCHL